MKSNINIIGIHPFSVATEMTNFAQSGVYRTVPMVLYKVNNDAVQHFMVQRSIEIFRENMAYGNLRNIVHGDEKFLSIPGKAYEQMRRYVNQNVNKVIADMITHIVVKIISELSNKDPKAHNVFFIDSIDTNKIIGRLGYLYLRSDVNTIAFVTYKASGLLTDTLNNGNENVVFDINYFKGSKGSEKKYSPIIPNDYMESLTQAVFYNLSTKEAQISPLRCDILSQGISTSKIEEKVKIIADILIDSNNMSIPYQERGSKGSSNNWIAIPQVLYECIEAENIYINVAQTVLEEELYAENR